MVVDDVDVVVEVLDEVDVVCELHPISTSASRQINNGISTFFISFLHISIFIR